MLNRKEDIISYIKSICDKDIIENYKAEGINDNIDIYIPEKKIAIIIKDTYDDFINGVDKKINQNRVIAGARLKIRMIHIFEYEWADDVKREKIKRYLIDTFNDNKLKIYARVTEVKAVDTEEAKEFINKYHLQGYTSATYNVGLYYKDELVSIMTFARPRFNHYYDYEIIRLCTKDNVQILGGTQKMFKRFVDNFSHVSILTYADITKFTGNIYTKLGFKVERISDPNYMWVSSDSKTALPRYRTQKRKLLRMLPEVDPRMTENAIMEMLGFSKVYDCGNLVLSYEK